MFSNRGWAFNQAWALAQQTMVVVDKSQERGRLDI